MRCRAKPHASARFVSVLFPFKARSGFLRVKCGIGVAQESGMSNEDFGISQSSAGFAQVACSRSRGSGEIIGAAAHADRIAVALGCGIGPAEDDARFGVRAGALANQASGSETSSRASSCRIAPTSCGSPSPVTAEMH